MSELEPLKEYLIIELWETESGAVTWRVKSQINEKMDGDLVESMIMEFAEDWVSRDKDPVIFTVMALKSGFTLNRHITKDDFTDLRRYLWFKSNLFRSHWNMMGTPRNPSKLLVAAWRLSWLWHKVAGHFKPSQNTAAAGATPVPTTPEDNHLDLSTVLRSGSSGQRGVVLQFPKVSK